MSNTADESERPYRYTTHAGQEIELPRTLGEIRASLPEDQREAFDEEMYSTPLMGIAARAIFGWATPEEDRQAAEDELDRIRQGHLNLVRSANGRPGRHIV
ncbi:hypothetical protein [Embleya sp. AB8]|uniref:hypothetical protein n=1 Tax=Embleya sp. AB8 TaxID=3156304 RepID=UPI003C75A513